MKKTLALVLTLSLLLLPFSTGIPIANAASNGTLQIAFNPNVKSITVLTAERQIRIQVKAMFQCPLESQLHGQRLVLTVTPLKVATAEVSQ